MRSFIRSAGIRGFRSVVEAHQGDAALLAERYGVGIDALDSDDVLVSDVAMGRLLEGAARELPCPDLGLQMALHQDIGILGPLAIAVQNAPTVGGALECASQFLFVHSPVLSFSIVADPEGRHGEVGLRYGSADGGVPPRQGSDVGLAFVHRMLRFLVGGPYGLHSVHLPHRPLATASRYTAFFGAEARFQQESALLRVPRSLLARPLTGVDETLREIALTYLQARFPEPGRTLAPQVRVAIDRSLGSTPSRIESTGRLLGMHPRTVQRKLAAEGTSFAILLDDARRESALRLITRTDLPFVQIAALVGLSEQSALTRCARRWFGATPRTVRAQGIAADPEAGAP
ncbi:AraC-like DNA-binding protein [Arthrobacter sp. CAN_A6]|uniref:AraC family transcriptional regulator ligand-binding domain-containing protein n=1 Tax=Arthrobacter sp. CAN_A6 TaxID=2787721 RepID=UPI0018CABAB0